MFALGRLRHAAADAADGGSMACGRPVRRHVDLIGIKSVALCDVICDEALLNCGKDDESRSGPHVRCP